MPNYKLPVRWGNLIVKVDMRLGRKGAIRPIAAKIFITRVRVFGSLKIQIQRLVFEIINKEKTPFLVNISKLTMWTE